MNVGACAALPRFPERSVWFRAIEPQYWPSALATVQTLNSPSRFSPAQLIAPAFPVLYLTENHLVALLEVGALLGSPYSGKSLTPNTRVAWTVLNVDVILHAVADLTEVASQTAIGMSSQELTGDWEGYLHRSPTTSVVGPTGVAPTQELGRALHAVPGLEGMRVPAAKLATNMNLVIFPDKLHAGSSVVFRHPATGQTWTISPPTP